MTRNTANMPSSDEDRARPALMVIDTAYTLEMIRELGNERSITCRDLDGFFRHVWSVHPLASLLTSETWASRYGVADWHEIAPRHTFVEGKIGRFAALRSIFPVNFLLAQVGLFIALLKVVRRQNVAAIRAGDPLYLGLLAWGLAKLTKKPFVIRINGNNDKVRTVMGRPLFPRLFRSVRIERFIEGFLLPRAAMVLAPTRDNLDWAISRGAHAKTGKLISFASLIDPRHFVPPIDRPSAGADLSKLGLVDGEFVICIGRLIKAKFPDHVLRVVAFLRDRGHNVKVVLVGEGEMDAELNVLAAELGIEDAVVMTGNRDQAWLARVVPHAALILSPSTGRALSETSLAGVPTVAYDTDWQSEMIETGVTGALVAYRDWQAMAKAADHLMTDRGEARRLGDQLRQRALMMLEPTEGRDQERAAFVEILSDAQSLGD